jgi:hypothetical protein
MSHVSVAGVFTLKTSPMETQLNLQLFVIS